VIDEDLLDRLVIVVNGDAKVLRPGLTPPVSV
jgi:hypothetical protein